MPLPNREVAHCHSFSIPDYYTKSDNHTCLLGVNMSALTGTLEQIGLIAKYSHEIFSSLMEEAKVTHQRVQALSVRVANVTEAVPQFEQQMQQAADSDPAAIFDEKNLPVELGVHESCQLFQPNTLPASLQARVGAINRPPDLARLDPLSDNDQSCLKLYSNPDYFMEAWTRAEQEKRKKARELKEERRKKNEALHGAKRVKSENVGKVVRKVYSSEGGDAVAPARKSSNLVRVQPIEEEPTDPLPQPSSVQPSPMVADDSLPPAPPPPGVPAPPAPPAPAAPAAPGIGVSPAPPPPPVPPAPGAPPAPPAPPAMMAAVPTPSRVGAPGLVVSPVARGGSTVPKPPAVPDMNAGRSAMLTDILGFQKGGLRRVAGGVDQRKKSKKPDGVAAILERRIAVAGGSDSEEEEEEGSDDEWDDDE